jgi:transcriptional regulator with XRE-family HTH domain
VPGKYFDLACALAGTSQEEVARRAGVAASTLSRAFSGKHRVGREKLLAWGNILRDLCPPEERDLLFALEGEMLHALGHATRDEEQRGIEQFPSYQERVREALARRGGSGA